MLINDIIEWYGIIIIIKGILINFYILNLILGQIFLV
jgi:hypothetical protein